MSVQKRFEEKDSAVSPVVGVMLMLVVTIVVAAVVAMFAMGTFSDAQPASTVVLKLDDYEMKIADYSGSMGGPYTAVSGDNTFVSTVSSVTESGHYANYAPYEMKFSNMGGDTLSIADLTLSITYNATTYKTPFSLVTEETSWAPGEVLKLDARKVDTCPTTTGTGNMVWVLGLSQQSMCGYWSGSTYTKAPKDYFDWSILDRSNNVIAKGTVYFPEEDKGTAPSNSES